MKSKFLCSVSIGALICVGALPAVAQQTDDQGNAAQQAEQQMDQAQSQGKITDLETVTEAADAAEFTGREVQLEKLQVSRVSGDKTFYVCSGEGEAADAECAGEEVLVLLREERQSETPQVEGRVDVDQGDQLTIETGRIGSYAQEQGELVDMDIGEEELALLSEAEYFIIADRVDMARAEGAQQAEAEQAQQQKQQQQQQQAALQESQEQQTAQEQQETQEQQAAREADQQQAQRETDQEPQQERQAQAQERDQQQAQAQMQGQQQPVNVVSLEEWDYEELYQGGWSADNLIGGTVHGPEGEDIGEVENIVLNAQGNIVAIIAEIGGFVDIGDTHVAVPWSEVKVRDYDDVVIPVTAENIEQYPATADQYFTQVDVGNLSTVEDDLKTGPQIWKATELLDEDVLLQNGIAYGYISDLIFEDDSLRSVVVSASNPAFGYGYYAYPFTGVGTGLWEPGLGYYTVPYGANEIGALDTFEYSMLDPGF